MGLIKRRPAIKLRVPPAIKTGDSFEGEIILEASKPVPIESVTVELLGTEYARMAGTGQNSVSRTVIVIRLGGVLSGPAELASGTTRYRCVFDLPADLPPTYRGPYARTEYKVTVRAAIPWWPDAEASFEIIVGLGRLVDTPPGRPQLFSSAPSGPEAQEAYVEGSLNATVMAPGDVLSGAVSFGNVKFNKYKGVRVALIGWQSLSIGRRRAEREVARYELFHEVDDAQEGASIRYDLRVPDDGLPPTWSSLLWQFRWYFEVRAIVRWGSDVLLRVPVVIVPKPIAARASTAPHFAPPSVGSERIRAIWEQVAREAGLAYEDGMIRGRAGGKGGTTFEIHRDHRGKDGIFLVAELEYPPLHIGLRVSRGKSFWQALAGGDVKLGDRAFDRKHQVTGWDAAQIQALGGAVVPALRSLDVLAMDDREARVQFKDAGQNPKRLRWFADQVAWLARALIAARTQIPAPHVMTEAVPAWRALAERLAGTLDTAAMAVTGTHQGLAAEIRTEWTPEGSPEATLVQMRAGYSLGEKEVEMVAGADGSLAVGDDAPLPGDVRPIVARLARGAEIRRLKIAGDEVTVTLPAPLFDPLPLLERLDAMGQLCIALRQGAGVYR